MPLLFVRRTSCPSPLESEFDTASRLRLGGPAVAYGSAVNEETGGRRRRVGVDRGRDPPLCTTDILSVASTSNASPRGEPCSTTKVTGRTKVAAICVPRSTRRARRYQGMNRWLSSFSLRALRVLRGCSNRVRWSMLGVANALVSSIACSGPDDGQDVRRTWGERMSA